MNSSLAPATHKSPRPRRRAALSYASRARAQTPLSGAGLEQARIRQAASPTHAYFACPLHFETSPSGRAQLVLFSALLKLYCAITRLLRPQ